MARDRRDAAIYLGIDAVLIRNLPVTRPAELVALGLTENVDGTGHGTPSGVMYSYPPCRDVSDANKVVTGVLATGAAGRVDVRIDSTLSSPNIRTRASSRATTSRYSEYVPPSAARSCLRMTPSVRCRPRRSTMPIGDSLSQWLDHHRSHANHRRCSRCRDVPNVWVMNMCIDGWGLVPRPLRVG